MDDVKKFFRQRGRWLFILLSAFSVLHIFMIMSLNIPTGPLQSALSSLYEGYVNPIFVQDWRLFAPNPKINDIGYLIRVKYDGDVSPWVDIASLPVNKKLADPLLPRKEYDMIEAVDLALRNWESEKLNALRDKLVSELSPEDLIKHKEDKNYRFTLVPVTPEEVKAKKVAEAFAFNLLSDYAKKTFAPGFKAVQLRSVEIPARPPKFDNDVNAHGKDTPVTRIDSDWLSGATL